MSCSKWAYDPEKCDGDYCVGDCDFCDKTDNEIAKKFRLFQLMLNDRWREQRKPKKYREDCFWYDEQQDMSAHIPVCNYKEYPDCYIHECPEHCKTYIKREKAMDILRKYVRSDKNEID